MDQDKIKQIQNQYWDDEEYIDESNYDELLQENTDDLTPDEQAVLVQQKTGAKNKIGSLITQVKKGETQPN